MLSGKQEANMNWIKCTDYEQAAYLCEHRKCDEHFLDRKGEGIRHRIPQWRGQHKGHGTTRSHHQGGMTCPEALKARSVPPTPSSWRSCSQDEIQGGSLVRDAGSRRAKVAR